MDNKFINWTIFCILSIIWGSSFVLMKEGLTALSPYQVASIRMLSSGLILLPFAFNAFKKIPKEKLSLVVLSGILGSFIPAYLFCIAETKIDSSLAGILNSLTPHSSVGIKYVIIVKNNIINKPNAIFDLIFVNINIYILYLYNNKNVKLLNIMFFLKLFINFRMFM